MRRTLPAFVWKICVPALMFAVFTAPQVRAQSAPTYPAWWASQGVLSGTAAPNDYAAANQGQAKNMAGAAVKELDTDLRQFGGAGSQLDQLMATLSGTTAQTDDYLAINLGQLKAILQPFYDRLLAVGYTGTSRPLSTGTYPWIGAGKVANDYAWANLGQLKNLFSFDVKYSSSGGTIPDWWIEKYFPGSTQNGEPSINPSGYVAWSDTVTYLQAYQQGLDPTDPYGGSLPVLTALNWGVITAEEPGEMDDVSVQVTDENGEPIPGAPVTFTIDYGLLMAPGASVSSASQTVQVCADSDGNASLSVIMPWWPDIDVTVTAEAETSGQMASAQFYGWTGDDNPSQPAIPQLTYPNPNSVSEPSLSVAMSSTSVANPAFEQYDPPTTGTVCWYLTQTENSYGSANYSILTYGDTYTYLYSGTLDQVQTVNPLFGGISHSGFSEFTGTNLINGNLIMNEYFSSNQSPDGSWTGMSQGWIAASGSWSAPYDYRAWGVGYYFPSYTALSSTEENFYNSPGEFAFTVSDDIVLSNQFTDQTFTQDVFNLLASPSTYYDGYDPGDTIAWRELADDSSSFSLGEATYKFKCASTGTAPYVFEWYEVFQPDDDTQPVQVSSKKEWDYANQQAESPPFTINPSTSGTLNGTWYIARLDMQTYAQYPECRWRHLVGVGEAINFHLVGLPASVSGTATWSISPSTSGSFNSDSPTGSGKELILGRIPGNVTITVTLPGGATMSASLTVIEPTGVTYTKIATIPMSLWDVGAGMWGQYTFLPTTVSFSGCVYQEEKCPATDLTGFYAMSHLHIWHNPNGPSGVFEPGDSNTTWISIRDDNTAADLDQADITANSITTGYFDELYSGGSGFTWNIPLRYRCQNDSDAGLALPNPISTEMQVSLYYGSFVKKGDASDIENP